MRRLLAFVIGLLIAWFGLVQPAAAVASPTSPTSACEYDSRCGSGQLESTVTERGPPAPCHHLRGAHDAVDFQSSGASARLDGTASEVAITYDHHAGQMHVASAAITTGRPVEATAEDFYPVVRSSVAANGGANAVRLGQAGENAVRSAFDIGPKVTRVINGRTRIFDGLNTSAVSEVKNVQRLSYTRQLRDYADYASQSGLRLDIYVRGGTNISGPLARADLDPMSPVNIIRYLE